MRINRKIFSTKILLTKFNKKFDRILLEKGVNIFKKAPERRQQGLSGVFIINFEHVFHLFGMFLLLTLNK